MSEEQGRREYVASRFLESQSAEDVLGIREELLDEGIPRGTVDTVKNELVKKRKIPNPGALVSLKRQFPQKLSRYDVITPEAVLQELRLQDGDYKVGFVDGIAMLLLATRLNQEIAATQAQTMQPMINMLSAMRQEEKDAAERARGSSMEIAREAAHQTALEMANFIDQRVPKGPPPKDMSEMITKRIDKMWDLMDHMMEQRMFPGYQAGRPPEGWETETVAPQPQGSAPAPQPAGAPEG